MRDDHTGSLLAKGATELHPDQFRFRIPGLGEPLFALVILEHVIHEFFAPAIILPSLSCVDHVKEPQPLKGDSRIIRSFFPVGMPVIDLV